MMANAPVRVADAFIGFAPEAPEAVAEFAQRASRAIGAQGVSFWRYITGTLHLESTWGVSAAEALAAVPASPDAEPEEGDVRYCLPLVADRRPVGMFVFHQADRAEGVAEALALPASALALALDHARLRVREVAIAERLNRLTSALQIPMAFVDAAWRVVQINGAFRAAHGLSEGERPETLSALWERIRPCYQEASMLDEHLADWWRHPLLGRVLEAEQVHPQEAHYRIVITPFPDERGGFEGAILSFYDVTQERRLMGLQADFIDSLEERVNASTQDLIQSYLDLTRANQRLRELDQLKSDFISTMSHELRTPLNLIVGFGSLLEDGISGTLAPDHQDWVRGILGASERLRVLVDNILDLSRLDAGRFPLYCAWIDPRGLIQQSVEELRVHPEAADKRLITELPFEAPEVWASPEAIYHHVLMNLAVNALKFTEPGGEIRIRLAIESGHWSVEVTDTGIGIPCEELDKIFQRFYQVDSGLTRRHNGSGLGLAIAKEVVSLHGGTIRAESQPGAGSRFTVRLPIEPQGAAPKEEACTK